MQNLIDDTNNIKTMLSAMLDRYIQDLFTRKDTPEKKDANLWIFNNSEEAVFNFKYVCEMLEICPKSLRRKILKYKNDGYIFEQSSRNKTPDFSIMSWFRDNNGNGIEPLAHLTELKKYK